MIFTPMASSSHGNAYLLDDGQTKLLIECGVPYRRLQRLLGFSTAELSGCVLSHEHKDHARCHLDLVKNGIRVYASEGTAQVLECELLDNLESRVPVIIGTMEVLPFPTFHDAAEPLGFLIRSQVDGEKLVFATDTVNLGYQFPGVNIAAIECNYDEFILARATKIPDKVVHRIRNSHMEIERSRRWLEKLDKSALREVWLLHLSDACSNENMFVDLVERTVGPGIEVQACPKER